MMYFKIAFLPLAALLFANVAYSADDTSINVAGLEMMMTPEEAFSILKESGFRRSKDNEVPNLRKQLSFSQLVTVAQDQRVKGENAWYRLYFRRKHEDIVLEFFAMPDSEVLVEVSYTNDDPAVSHTDFNDRVLKKYGEPNFDSFQRTHMWCEVEIDTIGYGVRECPEGNSFLKADSYRSEKTLRLVTSLKNRRSKQLADIVGNGKTSF